MDIYGCHGYHPGHHPGYLWMSPWISFEFFGYLLSSTLDIYDASAEEKAGNPSPYQAASWWWELGDLDVQWPYTLQQQVGRPWVLKRAKIRFLN